MGSSSFFQNLDCAYFPCHAAADPARFNCLFCFCPLYHLGRDCGGAFEYLGAVKDCSGCLYPHQPEHYDEICRRLGGRNESLPSCG